MGKINLSTTAINHQCRQVFSCSTCGKHGLPLRRFVPFWGTTVLLYFLSFYVTNAQYQYNQTSEFLKANSHWAFGQGSGLEFSSGTALPLQTSVTGMEGHATVSDRNTGNLLFYTNGGFVWNANHSIMPNGAGLMGSSGDDYSTSQGSLIVPFINDRNKYYLFSLAAMGSIHTDPNSGKKGSLFYNVVDSRLDNGNGDVDTNYKNIVLDTNSLSEALIAIPGCNNDIWVLVHSFDQSPKIYKAYHITEQGINTTPIISESSIDGGIIGSLSVSPNREKLVLTTLFNFVELANFDPLSGKVTNSILLEAEIVMSFYGYGYYSSAFSPDNLKLYISYIRSYDFTNFSGGLLQYDLSIFDSARIHVSRKVIDSVTPFVSIRLYNDTIYTTDFYSPQSIHRINQPNNTGFACDLEQNAIALSGNSTNLEGSLGNEVVFPDFLAGNNTDTIICSGLKDPGIVLKANYLSQGFSYRWSTGDSTESITINDQGIYWVKYGDGCKYTDSFIIRGSDLFTTITVNGFELGTTGGPFESYQWYLNGEPISGATHPTHTVTENGNYTVEITDSYGCVYLSEVYEVTNVNIKDLQQLTGAISIYPNPATEKLNIDAPIPVQFILTGIDGKELLKGNNAVPVNISSLAQGFYFLTVTDIEGWVLKTEKIIKQ